MDKDIEALFRQKITPTNFNRTIGLFGAVTIGVGALLGAGIYVLIGSAASVAGPSVILSYLLCGSLAYVTTIMYADLSRMIPRSGGGYTYVYNILGSVGGFATGWFLALGSILASSLYAIGFSEYAVSLLGLELPHYTTKAIAIGITLLITLLNLRPSGKSNIQNWIVWGNVAILLSLVVFSLFQVDSQNIEPFFPKGFGGTLGAISLIYISFFGYQLIANNADEIKEPEKTIPKAMKLSMLISILIYVLVAVVAVMTVPWKELAASSAPLVVLATKSFGGKAWIIISLGGVLASLGALSSTLISQSRQSYAMGKDRFFPDALGELNKKTQQPQWSILIGGLLTSLALVTFNMETIAKVTNFSLLLSLLPVSLALRRLYKSKPELKPKSKFKLFLPEISLVINLGLLFTMDLLSLALGQQLIIAGAIIYIFYSRKREQTGREGRNIVLYEKKEFSFFQKNKVLVPVSNPETQSALLMFSNTLMAKKGGEIVVLAVKDVPPDMDFYEALSGAKETLNVIKKSIEIGKELNIKLKPIIRASRDVASGIVNAAKEENCELIITGFPKNISNLENTVFYKTMRKSYTDMLILNLKTVPDDFNPKTIAVYVKRRKNLSLMLMCATAVAEKRNARIQLIAYLPEKYNMHQKRKLDTLISDSILNLKSPALYDVNIRISNNPVESIIELSKELDVLIIGKDERTKNRAPGETDSFKITKNADCSVLLVKSASKLKKITQMI